MNMLPSQTPSLDVIKFFFFFFFDKLNVVKL